MRNRIDVSGLHRSHIDEKALANSESAIATFLAIDDFNTDFAIRFNNLF
jgi:hypothetical protein